LRANRRPRTAIARILIVRLDGIGDALVCAPLVVALRDAGHQIGIALSDRNAGVFNASAFLAQHVLTRIPWPQHGSTLESTAGAVAEIAQCAYDTALIVSEEPEAFELARPIAARVGFVTGWSKPLKTLWVRRHVTTAIHRAANVRGERVHEAEIIFRLGAGLHREPSPPRDVPRLRGIIIDAPPPQRRDVVVQLGAKWHAMGLEDAKLRTLVTTLRSRDARFIASAAEREAAAALVPDGALEIMPDIAAWKRCIDGARAVVTVDSGAAHLAGMLGVPVIDIFPDRDADANVTRWHPWAAPYATMTASALRTDGGVAAMGQFLDAH